MDFKLLTDECKHNTTYFWTSFRPVYSVMCNTVLFLYTQSENIKLNPTISSACESDVDLYCQDVSAGAGKVHNPECVV